MCVIHVDQQLQTQHWQNLLFQQAVNVACTGSRRGTRYRPSLLPEKGTKAHTVGLVVCGFLCLPPERA